MFRTRDFILIFVSVIFLLAAIGVTVFKQNSSDGIAKQTLKFVETEDTDYSAEEYAPEEISRAERLADMKSKIAAGQEITIAEPEVALEEEEVDESTEVAASVEQRCPNYSLYFGNWVAATVESKVSTSNRIYYTTTKSDITSSSSQPSAGLNESILLEISLYPVRNTNNSCVSSDVVGVAQDGSLIRNKEAGLYGVFGQSTVVGYALDGFPIYGTSGFELDECGGSSVSGQYGYYISPDRTTVLNCFAGTPASI